MPGEKKRTFYYGWVIVGLAFISMAISYALRYSFSIFSIPLETEFGWSRGSIYTAVTIILVIYGFSSPVTGKLFDRFGPRQLFPIGACILALGLIGLSQITQLWQLYLFSVIGAVGMSFLGYVPNGTLVSIWFVKKRGAAVGAAVCGTGFGMFVIVGFIMPWIIEHYGFRWAYFILGAGSACIIVPLAAIFLRHRPQDMGLLPDGVSDNAQPENSNDANSKDKFETVVDRKWVETEWTLSKALKTPRYWALFTTGLLYTFSQYSVAIHQVQYAVDAGFDMMVAGSAFGLVGLFGMAGKFGWGFISDRIGRELTWTLGIVCNVIGVSILMAVNDPSQLWMLYSFSAFFGLSYGMGQPIVTAMNADLFQGKNLGSIFGFGGIAIALGGAWGPLFSAYLFDVTGSYQIPFTVAILSVSCSVFFVWLAGPRKVRLVAGRAKAAEAR